MLTYFHSIEILLLHGSISDSLMPNKLELSEGAGEVISVLNLPLLAWNLHFWMSQC